MHARYAGLIPLQGDAVLLKAEGNQAWVGLICDFFEDEGEEGNVKMARFMWFLSEKEIRNKSTKRTDFLPVCPPSPLLAYTYSLVVERALYIRRL